MTQEPRGSVASGRSSAVPTLAAQGLSKSYSGVSALDDVSLELWPGEVHALIGENGAGKSTLMRILAGEIGLDAGSLRIGGQVVRLGSPVAARENGVALIHQDTILAPHLSVAENMFLGRLPRRGPFLDRQKLGGQARQALARVDPQRSIPVTSPLSSLPVAKRQLVDIARALTLDARVLIMDEPTASFSETESEQLYRVIEELRAAGVAILYSSHHLAEVSRLSDRVTVLRDGRLVGQALREDISELSLTRMMLGRDFPTEDRSPVSEPLSDRAPHFETRRLTGPGFSDISVDVGAGEILGIYGLVGAGRSEFLHAVYGLTKVESGEVWIEGSKVDIRNPKQAIRYGVGLVPEDRKGAGVFGGRSVRDNLLVAGYGKVTRFGVLSPRLQQRAAAELKRSLRVKAARLDMKAAGLSGGNQQKLVIGRWLHRGSRVLLLDEPTKGVDVGAKADVYRLIDDLAADGACVVVVSSEPAEVLRLSHRVIVMSYGAVVADLTRDHASEDLIRAYAFGPEPLSAT
jgi:ribose transport system ATP-binding protein